MGRELSSLTFVDGVVTTSSADGVSSGRGWGNLTPLPPGGNPKRELSYAARGLNLATTESFNDQKI